MIEKEAYQVDPKGFGFRVAGILLHKGKVLLTTDDHIDSWVLPGGGVKPFESSEDAIKREFQEETGIEIEVDRLLWIVENSFIFDHQKFHGIGLTFLVNPIEWGDKLTQEEFYGVEDDFKPAGTRYEHLADFKITFRWFDIAELDTITIKPKVYHQALKNIPEHPVLLRNLEVEK